MASLAQEQKCDVSHQVFDKVNELFSFIEQPIAPDVEGSSDFLTYETGWSENSTNFEDEYAYRTNATKETDDILRMCQVCESGNYFLHQLYSYRNISKVLPKVKQTDSGSSDHFRKIFDVLDPQISKIRRMLIFFDELNVITKSAFSFINNKLFSQKCTVSDMFLTHLMSVFDIVIRLDGLKNFKHEIHQDYQTYLRVIPNMDKVGLDPHDPILDLQSNFMSNPAMNSSTSQITAQNVNFFMFKLFSSPSYFTTYYKQFITEKIENYELVVEMVANLCFDYLENGIFLTLDEQHRYIRVLILCFTLIDVQNVPSLASNKNIAIISKLLLPKAIKVFKTYPIVALFGDIPFDYTKTVLKKISFFSDFAINEKEEAKVEKDTLLISNISTIRNDYANYIGTLTIHLNKLENTAFGTKKSQQQQKAAQTAESSSKPAINLDFSREVRSRTKEIIEQGLKLISSMTIMVLQQMLWKNSHPPAYLVSENNQFSQLNGILNLLPASNQKNQIIIQNNAISPSNSNLSPNPSPISPTNSQNQNSESDGTNANAKEKESERACTNYYSQAEMNILAEVLGMIKTLAKKISKNSALLVPIIKSQLYFELQEFTQLKVEDILDKTKKKKRPVHSTVLEMQQIVIDAIENENNTQVSASASSKKLEKTSSADKSNFLNTFALEKEATPSFTQFHLFRSVLTSILSEKSSLLKKQLSQDFTPEQIKTMSKFVTTTFFFGPLINLKPTLLKISDVSDLGLRENLPQSVEFSIEMSLPSSLIENLIKKRNISYLENLMFPFSIYNDLAIRYLFNFQKRYLYDELEAEVNFVFDQLMYRISDQMYTTAKIEAAHKHLDTNFRSELEKNSEPLNLQPSKLDFLTSLKTVKILGRNIDLNVLLSQRMNSEIRENINVVIRKFECSPLTCIIELENMIEVMKQTHKILSKNLTLDDFDSILSEVNESATPGSFKGRIASHISEELFSDFFFTYNFNVFTQRFIESPIDFEIDTQNEQKYTRDRFPKVPSQLLFGSKLYNVLFSKIHENFNTFFGMEHVSSIIRLVGRESLAIIIENCILFLNDCIQRDLSPYMSTLMEAIPPQIKLHDVKNFSYQIDGIYDYFVCLFEDFINYDQIKQGVFQTFKSFGNCLAFLLLFDNSSGFLNITEAISVSPFLGIRALSTNEKKKRKESKISQSLDELENNFIINPQNPMLDKLEKFMSSRKPPINNINNIFSSEKASPISSTIISTANRASKIYLPKQNFTTSFFNHAIDKISNSFLSEDLKESWKQKKPSNSPNTDETDLNFIKKLDSSCEFYRLFGILEFIFCIHEEKQQEENDILNKFTNLDIFGDAFLLAGMTLIYLFGQKNRFEAFNFTDHILRNVAFSKGGKDKIKNFIQISKHVKEIKSIYFSILQNSTSESTKSKLKPKRVEIPESDDYTKVNYVATAKYSPSSSNSNQLFGSASMVQSTGNPRNSFFGGIRSAFSG